LRDVLKAYKQIVADHGSLPRAEAGIGNCFFLFGRYREATDAYRRAGVAYRAREREALEYLSASKAIGTETGSSSVRQLLHMPSTDRWVALLGPPHPTGLPGTSWEHGGFPNKLVVFQEVRGTNRFRRVGKSKDLGEFWAASFSTIYLTRLAPYDRKWSVLLFRQGIGDCQPYDIRLFSIRTSGLRTLKAFEIYSGAWVRGPSRNHGLLVMLGPLWHVDWNDLYEWKDGKFRLANRRFPQYFPISEQDSERNRLPEYAFWMDRGAVFDIQGKFREAEKEWRKALKRCRLAIWRTRHGIEDRSYDHGSYGTAIGNLPKIRQRLRWLARHDYNHLSLYRPISDGIESK
jgi:tetratricopeptide (TPR) repeat protein